MKLHHLAIMSIGVVAAALIMAPRGDAATINLTTAVGLGADTFLNGGGTDSPNFPVVARRDSNFGGREELVVKYAPLGSNNNSTDFDSRFTRVTLLRFDLSSVVGTVTAASLTLGVKLTEDASDGNPANVSVSLQALKEVSPFDAAPLGGGWDETGITMASFTAGGGFSDLTAVAGLNTVLGGQTSTQFTGSLVLSSVLGDTNGLLTFAILPFLNSPQGIQFFSKENQDGGLFPTLQLTVEGVSPVPIPAALPLFLSGLLGLGVMARRRRKQTTA